MTNIQTRAFHIYRKPSKTTIEEYLIKLYDDSVDYDTREIYAAMYKYFQAPPTKKSSNIMEWAFNFVDKKEERQYLTLLYCSGDYIEATNGHIAIRTPNTQKLAVGYYDVKGVKIENEWTFPDINRVFIERQYTSTLNLNDVTYVKEFGEEIAIFTLLPNRLATAGISFKVKRKYLELCFNGEASLPVKFDSNTEPLHFTHKNADVLLLPRSK